MTGQTGFTEGENLERAARDTVDMVTKREQAGLTVHLLSIIFNPLTVVLTRKK